MHSIYDFNNQNVVHMDRMPQTQSCTYLAIYASGELRSPTYTRALYLHSFSF